MDTSTTFIYSGAQTIHFSYAGEFWIEAVDGASSVSITVSKTQSVGQVGATQTAQTVEPRTIKIRGSYHGDVEANRRKLLDAVAPGVPATFTVTQNGESWYLDGVPTKTPDCTDGPVVQEFQFSLYCPFPYWRSAAQELTPVSGLISLFKTPFFTGGTWYISRIDRNYKNVFNSGNVEMPFQVIFKAITDVTNPEIYLVEQRKYIRLGTTARPYLLRANETALVSTAPDKSVKVTRADGTTENIFRNLDMKSDINAVLLPGDNLVRRAASTGEGGLRAYIRRDMGVCSGL
ncbi:MAG: phage tail family protein [Ruthenibacterium sp.]